MAALWGLRSVALAKEVTQRPTWVRDANPPRAQSTPHYFSTRPKNSSIAAQLFWSASLL